MSKPGSIQAINRSPCTPNPQPLCSDSTGHQACQKKAGYSPKTVLRSRMAERGTQRDMLLPCTKFSLKVHPSLQLLGLQHVFNIWSC